MAHLDKKEHVYIKATPSHKTNCGLATELKAEFYGQLPQQFIQGQTSTCPGVIVQ